MVNSNWKQGDLVIVRRGGYPNFVLKVRLSASYGALPTYIPNIIAKGGGRTYCIPANKLRRPFKHELVAYVLMGGKV